MPSVFLGVVVCVMFRGAAATQTFLFSDFLDKRPTENKTVKIKEKDHFAIAKSPQQQQQQQHWLVISISRLYNIPCEDARNESVGGKNLSCQKMDMPVM